MGCGDAKDVICGTVEKLEADTLVMGSHGYGFIKRYKQLILATLSFQLLPNSQPSRLFGDLILFQILQGSLRKRE